MSSLSWESIAFELELKTRTLCLVVHVPCHARVEKQTTDSPSPPLRTTGRRARGAMGGAARWVA